MLKTLRKHTKLIVWMVVISFALWGGFSATSLKKEARYAGELFGKDISFQEFNRFYRTTQIFMPPQQVSPADPEILRGYTWQNLIYAKEAKRQKIQVSDEEVRSELGKIFGSQGLENLQPEQYQAWLQKNLRISAREFEEGLREFIRIQKLLRLQMANFQTTLPSEKEGKEFTEDELAEAGYQTFLKWSHELNRQAGLKDYLVMAEKESSEKETSEEENEPLASPEFKA